MSRWSDVFVTMRTLGLVAIVGAAPIAGCHAAGDDGGTLRLVQTIPLPGVNGRIDHMAVDPVRHRLFVAALGNDTVEVVDLTAGVRLRSLTGFHEPQGVGYDPKSDSLLVANGESGDCDFFAGDSLAPMGKVHLGDDADDVRIDTARGTAVVGYGAGALAFVDVAGKKLSGSVRVSGHPEAFALDAGTQSVYLNIPSAGRIAVIDQAKRRVTALWNTDAEGNFPMDIDEGGHRLFVGYRNPPRLTVYNTTTGKAVDSVGISGDADDISFDASRKRVYVSCGAGSVDVIDRAGGGHYRRLASVPTTQGARTSLFVPDSKRLYVAAPQHGRHAAEILVFAVQP